MKKAMMAAMAVAAAAMAITASSAVMAEEIVKVEADGIAFEIPAELADLVTVETEGLSDGALVNVYETASIEAAKALEYDYDGAGWLFGISHIPEDRMKQLRCGGMDGMEVFAEDDDFYLTFDHPTDVTMVRESNEEMDAGMDQWSQLNSWARGEVMDEIIANNPELSPETFTNTELDMYLSRAAFEPGTDYEVISLMFGGKGMKASEEDDFIEDLADDFTYQMLDDVEAPDGEYIVLNFEEEGVRFEFFLVEEGKDLIREVRTLDGEEYETLYEASVKDADDTGKTTSGIMQEWCDAILDRAND